MRVNSTDSLPFKGRVGVGMGLDLNLTHPPPNLPLEGGGTWWVVLLHQC